MANAKITSKVQIETGNKPELKHSYEDSSFAAAKYNTRTYTIADATNNQAIDLNGITNAQVVHITTDEEIVLRLNSTDEITITPKLDVGTGTPIGIFMTSSDNITAADISNNSGSTATVVVTILES